jgi:LysM repeat protein
VPPGVRLWLARLAAPAALLLAATAAVLLIQNALDSAGDAGSSTTTTETTPVTTRPATTRALPRAQPSPATTAVEAEFYTVRSGDTLETIADQYGTSVEELLLLNPDVDPVELSIGQRIRVQ